MQDKKKKFCKSCGEFYEGIFCKYCSLKCIAIGCECHCHEGEDSHGLDN